MLDATSNSDKPFSSEEDENFAKFPHLFVLLTSCLTIQKSEKVSIWIIFNALSSARCNSSVSNTFDRLWYFKRKQYAITLTHFEKRLNRFQSIGESPTILLFAVPATCVWSSITELRGAKEISHFSDWSSNQVGPDNQSLSDNFSMGIPRVPISHGVNSPLMCFHSSIVDASKISAALLATIIFCFLSAECNH